MGWSKLNIEARFTADYSDLLDQTISLIVDEPMTWLTVFAQHAVEAERGYVQVLRVTLACTSQRVSLRNVIHSSVGLYLGDAGFDEMLNTLRYQLAPNPQFRLRTTVFEALGDRFMQFVESQIMADVIAEFEPFRSRAVEQ